MALHSLRLRRTLSVLSAFHRYAAVSGQTIHSIFCPSAPSLSKSPAMISLNWPLRLSSMASYSRLSFASNSEDDKIGTDIASGSEDDKIGTDIASGSEDVKIGTDIACGSEDVNIGNDIASGSEDVKIGTDIASGDMWTDTPDGCDYNHWLIIMDFKDSKPTPEEMVRTYEETCAKGLNISVEEAKQKIYACTTTTYQGFQAVMTKEESEKFRGLPGVLFILPDSYIDPVNKEYGGDKYINGTVIPRPPPPPPPPKQYGGRQVRKDRSGILDRPRYERPPTSAPNRQANPSFNQPGSMQGDERHSRVSQNYSPQGPSQNYGPLELRERRDHSPMNTSALEGRDTYQGGRGPLPSHRGNYIQRVQESYNYDVQGNYPSQREQIDYMPPPGQSNYGSGFTPRLGERSHHSPMNIYASEGRDSYQGGRGPMPYHQVNYNQRGHGSYNHEVQGNYLPQGEQRDYGPPPSQSNYGSGFTRGLRERRDYSHMNTYATEGRDSYLGGRGPMPYNQVNYIQRVQESYNHDVQGNYQSQREQIDYVPPPGQSSYGSGFTRGLGERRDHSPTNNYALEGRDSYHGGRGPMPYHQVNYNQRGHGSYNHDVQGNYFPQGEQRDYVPPPGQSNYGSGFTRGLGERRDYSPMNTYVPEGRDSYHGGRVPMPYHQVNYNQRRQGNYTHDVQENCLPQREQIDYVPRLGQGIYCSGFNLAQGGPYEQGRYRGHGEGMPYGQGQGYGSYPSSIEGQRFSQGFQRNMQEEQRNYISCGQTWYDQWKF